MKHRVLVVGDIMLDKYTFVDWTRKAPEAPIFVWDHQYEELRAGGAANVANNLAAMNKDIEVVLIGISGQGIFCRKNVVLTHIVSCCRGGMVKHRFVDKNEKIIFRYDNFKKFENEDVDMCAAVTNSLLSREAFDAVIVSDYDKGTVTKEMMEGVLSQGAPVVVDSKRGDLSIFQGASILKVNEEEYGRQVSAVSKIGTAPEFFFDYVVVTKGSKGAELRMLDRTKSNEKRYLTHVEQFPIEAVNPVDVTGCGDTHTAALVWDLIRGGDSDIRRSIKFANDCARDVVQKFGTSVVG